MTKIIDEDRLICDVSFLGVWRQIFDRIKETRLLSADGYVSE
jgi:hypothetical protein